MVVPLLASMISQCIGTPYAKTVFPVARPAGSALPYSLAIGAIMLASCGSTVSHVRDARPVLLQP